MTPRTFVTPGALALVSLTVLSACSTVPSPNAQLTQAKADFRTAEGDPRAKRLAAPEMKQAQDALNAAHAAWERLDTTDDVNHLAYLARQRVTIASETMALRSAEQAVDTAGATRSNIRLQARTQEADTAQRQATQAQQDTAVARADTAEAQRQTDMALAQNRTLQERLRELNAKPSPRGLVVTLGDVLFDTDKAQLKPAGIRLVQQLAGVLNEYPERTVLVEGFTDSTGTEAHNLALSGQRADAVRMALLSDGIAPTRVATRGHGESSPVASNDTADGRVLNRRVEILLSDARGFIVAR
jgi:outer membrane protein OmpA-like peptidoglycan-associated protein